MHQTALALACVVVLLSSCTQVYCRSDEPLILANVPITAGSGAAAPAAGAATASGRHGITHVAVAITSGSSPGTTAMTGHAGAPGSSSGGTTPLLPKFLQDGGSDATQLPTTFWRFTWRDQLGIVLSAVVALVTAPGGGAGATLYIPLFHLLLGFSLRATAALTSCVVFIGAFTSTAYALAEPHPTNAARTRVDWCSVLVMAPPLLIGVSLGVILNAVLPVFLLNTLTITVFGWSLQRMLRAYLRIRRVEAAQRADAAAAAAAVSAVVIVEPLAACKAGLDEDEEDDGAAGAVPCSGCQTAARARLATWWALQPAVLQVLVLVVLAVHVAFALIIKERTAPCTPVHWALLGCACTLLALLTVAATFAVRGYSRRWWPGRVQAAIGLGRPAVVQVVVGAACCEGSPLAHAPGTPKACAEAAAAAAAAVRQTDDKVVLEAPPPKGHGPNWEAIQWTDRNLSYMPLLMVVASAVAGCLGLSCGFLVTPLLLGMGVHPQVQAATSRVIMFISVFAIALLYLIQGRMPLYYGLVHGLISLLLGPVGIWGFDRIIAATGRSSLMVLLNISRYALGLTLLLLLSAVPSFIETAQGLLPVGFQMGLLCANANEVA